MFVFRSRSSSSSRRRRKQSKLANHREGDNDLEMEYLSVRTPKLKDLSAQVGHFSYRLVMSKKLKILVIAKLDNTN
ncbi:hypothetical protein Ddc_08699 [Ditylenchus destructor]|nr:hypothetical protein Ddc_08699 [Ditylenchus destructor]